MVIENQLYLLITENPSFKKIMRIILLLFILFTASISNGQNTFSIVVSISNIQVNDSKVFIGLYDNELNFKTKTNAIDSLIFIPKEKNAEVSFNKISPGIYAIAVFQDINSNGKLDTKGFNLPDEPVGISNFTDGKKLGIPTYNKAKIKINGDTIVSIPLIFNVDKPRD